MSIAIMSCVLLVALTTLTHYEILRLLSFSLPELPIAPRAKLLVVMHTAFLAHGIQIFLYGFAFYLLSRHVGSGALGESTQPAFRDCMYFSAETYSSLGYGDILPKGPLRLLAGVEALNGLLLIGWSASYIYLSMERLWNEGN